MWLSGWSPHGKNPSLRLQPDIEQQLTPQTEVTPGLNVCLYTSLLLPVNATELAASNFSTFNGHMWLELKTKVDQRPTRVKTLRLLHCGTDSCCVLCAFVRYSVCVAARRCRVSASGTLLITDRLQAADGASQEVLLLFLVLGLRFRTSSSSWSLSQSL